MNLLLFLCGVFVLADGAANILYCLLKRIDYQVSRFFQLGRAVRVIAGMLILLVAFGSVAGAQNTVTVFQNQEFSVFSNMELVTHQAPFNISLQKGNVTFNLSYENLLEGVKYGDSFARQVTVLLDNKPVFTKTFAEGNVQAFSLTQEITVASTGNHTGLLIIAGIGETDFYGTYSLSFEAQGENGDSQGLDFNFLGLDLWLWLLLFGSAGAVIIVAVVKRRRSHE